MKKTTIGNSEHGTADHYVSLGTSTLCCLDAGFIALGKMRSGVIDWESIIDHMCKLRNKGRFALNSCVRLAWLSSG